MSRKGCKYKIHGRSLEEMLPVLFPRMSSCEIGKEYGVSPSSVVYWAKKLGLRHDEETAARLKKKRWFPSDGSRCLPPNTKYYQGKDLREIVLQYYPDMSTKEMSKKFGWTPSRINIVAKELGIRHSENVYKKHPAPTLRRSWTDEQKRKRSEDLKRLFKEEERRILSGLPRKTKYHLRTIPLKILGIKIFLCKRRNYFSDNDIDPMALFYDAETIRFSPSYRKTEEDYAKEYGLQFLPADDYEEDKLSSNNE